MRWPSLPLQYCIAQETGPGKGERQALPVNLRTPCVPYTRQLLLPERQAEPRIRHFPHFFQQDDSKTVVLFFAFPPSFPYGSRNTANDPCMALSVSCVRVRGWHLEKPSLGTAEMLAQVLTNVP
jgi:hypothetical protein